MSVSYTISLTPKSKCLLHIQSLSDQINFPPPWLNNNRLSRLCDKTPHYKLKITARKRISIQLENILAENTSSISVFMRESSNKSCLEVNPNHAEIMKVSNGLQTGHGKRKPEEEKAHGSSPQQTLNYVLQWRK